MHGVGDRQLLQRPAGDPAPLVLSQRPAVDQHAQDLLGVERVALRPLTDPAVQRLTDVIDVQQRGDQDVGVLRAERRQRHRGGVALTGAPRWPIVQQLGPGRAEDHHLAVREAVADVLDQVEQRRGRPVDVLEDDQRRPPPAQLPEVARPRPYQRPAHIHAVKLGDSRARLLDPDGVGDRVQQRLVAQRHQRGRELHPGDRGRIAFQNAGVLLDYLGQRPPGHGIAVGQAATDQHESVGLGRRELPEQARLANAGSTEQGDQLRHPLAAYPPGQGREQRQLVVAADHGRVKAGDAALNRAADRS
jgi:hypothetical protein